MAAQILVPVCETGFLGFSYGCRLGRGTHDALDARTVGIEQRKVNWILDVDIRAFFDTLSRDWMLRFLSHRIGDKRVLRLIAKWLNAGVMEDGTRTDAGTGTPQGAIVSPVLANVYLHDAFDLWFQRKWRQRIADGETIVIRHADDRAIGLQHRSDAERFLQDLRHRLARFGLELHSRKTRLMEFGRFASANRKARGIGKPKSFDFLGMTHYCATTLKGGFRVGRKPSRTRVNRTLKRIKEALRRQWHVDERELAAWLGRVLRGWLNYYAVPGSGKLLRAFRHPLRRLFLRALRRRSQADRTSRGQDRSPDRPIPAPDCHPSPVARPAACRLYPREELDALARLSGSVRGDRGNSVPYRDSGGSLLGKLRPVPRSRTATPYCAIQITPEGKFGESIGTWP